MNYINTDIGNMRRDALRRTREMHRQNINNTNVQAPQAPKENIKDFPAPENSSNTTLHAVTKPKAKPQSKKQGGLNGLLSGLMNDGKLDNDKIIIIALILILAKDGADLKLLIALGYILM